MIIVMKPKASQQAIDAVVDQVKGFGFTPHLIQGVSKTVIGAVGEGDKERLKALINLDGVEKVVPVQQPYKLASRTTKEDDTVVDVNGVSIGGGSFVMIAGPCSVETREQLSACAETVRAGGAQFLRGGAYKPRTSPYSFQGLEEEGLKLLKEAKEATGLGIVTELLSSETVDLVDSYTDIIQIGARNMQNFSLLKNLGRVTSPVLLKRGLCATLEELLMSAEYILSEGNYNVILCERGIRTHEKAYRNTLDLNAVPALKTMTHLPIIVDPSHGTGRRDLVARMCKAAIAAGADGVTVEIHPNPALAYSDGPQALTLDEFRRLMDELRPYIELEGKTLAVLA